MPKRPNQKERILHMEHWLSRHTDEEHPVTILQIQEHLKRLDMEVDRKTVTDDLEMLSRFGMDIESVWVGRTLGYYVGERAFQLPELKLLVDTVQASRFLTRKKATELIGKLETLVSEYEARKLHRQVWVRGRIRTMNESIYYSVDAIHSAIEADQAVSFRYYDWNPRRERIFRHGGRRYSVSPWALMWNGDNYYLVAYDHADEALKHFRVDKLSSIRALSGPRLGEDVFSRFDMAAYGDSHFGMFSGEVEPVTLRFDNSLAGPVIDRFGTDAILVPGGDGCFTVTVSVAVNVQFYGWLCGFGDRVTILSPSAAVEGMREHVASLARRYGLIPGIRTGTEDSSSPLR